MSIPSTPDETLAETAKAYLANDKNAAATGRALGLAASTVKDRLRTAARRGLLAPASEIVVMPGYEVSRVQTGPKGTTVEQKQERGGQFEIPEGHRIKGVSAYIGPDGREIGKWVKTAEGDLDPEELVDRLLSRFSEWMPPEFVVPEPENTDWQRLTVYPLADIHLGLKAFADEAPIEYDLHIAAKRFRETTEQLFERSPNSEKALILQMGDWTHANDGTDTTPRGKHKLDVSDRLLSVIDYGADLLVEHIYRALKKHKFVHVKLLPGNHDLDAWIALYVAIKQRFRDEPRVTLDRGTTDYWFYRFGKTLIGAHHGHRLSPTEMAGAMATECREDWGETNYHWFLHGHLHHLIVKEVMGVRVECFRTLAESDAHHAGKFGSGKSLVSVTLHRELGEESRAQINIPPAKRRAYAA